MLTRHCNYSYLQIVFPLVACALSLAVIAVQCARHWLSKWRQTSYRPLDSNGGAVVPYTPADNDDDDDDNDEDVASVMLNKSLRRVSQTDFEVSRPKGQLSTAAVEILFLAAEVAVWIAVLVTGAGGRHGTQPAIAKLVSWSYILILAGLRFALTVSDRQTVPRLWNHTAALYGAQWLCTVMVFRSSIIHPRSHRAQVLSILEFCFATVLLLIAVVTRRGNRTVVLLREDGLEPPRHTTASLLSLLSFSWIDPLIFKGYRRPLELEDVWNLTVNQHAAAILNDFRQAYRSYTLVWRLLRYFDRMLIIQAAWTVFSNLFIFLPTLLLKAILEYVENPQSKSTNAAWFYAVLLFVSGAIQATGDGQALWIGRQIGLKLRAIIIGEIYAKALRRKAGATGLNQDEDEAVSSGGGDKKKQDKVRAMEQAKVGTIINLMAIDSFKVSEACAYLHFLWASVPTQVIVAIVLLYRVLGFSSFAGIALMMLLIPVNVLIARQFRAIQNKILEYTDKRIHSTNEVLQNIRIIKYFAWEQRFEDSVNEKRRVELKALRNRYILWSIAATVWYGTPILITFTSFFLYTVVEHKRLTPSVAFPALSMFTLLRVPLDQLADMIAHVQESKVSIDRVEAFLNEEETDKYVQLRDSQVPGQPPRIGLEHATLAWSNQPRDGTNEGFRLIDIDVQFKPGKLNVIAGPTGSGKTSLLMALLGEMKLLEGRVFLPGLTTDRASLPVDPDTLLTESVAYCAQEAWLLNDTIRENIVFASPFDKQRYNAVIKACALERDLQILEAGDQTMVGEKGISLSGGQKQRISLARAMYSRARHLLLDDCLSAVDSHTVKHIFREAIMGPLMLHRTCILVTHNVALAAPEADWIVVLDNGRVAAQGTPDDVAASGALGDELLRSRPTSRAGSSGPSRVASDLEEQREAASNGNLNGQANGAGAKTATHGANDAVNGKQPGNKLTESKAIGSVKWSTIRMYVGSMGSWYYWIIATAIFCSQQIGSVATNVWIRQWANAYYTEKADAMDAGHLGALSTFKFPSFVTGNVPRLTSWSGVQVSSSSSSHDDVSSSANGEVEVSYYLFVYALLGLVYVCISLLREATLFWGSLQASQKLHGRLLKAVVHAKFRFFDSTPLGQLMNRFSKDIEAIDQEVAPVAIGMLHCLASVIMIVVLISVVTPGFLIAGIFITLLYSAVGAIYLGTSRDLKRLESVQRSPLYQQFGETLNGIVTIRAYGDSQRFMVENHKRIDQYARPHIYLWASNRWLAFRIDITGALVSFCSAAFVLMNVGRIDAGAAGLSLTYAVTFTENVLWLVRLYAESQQHMNSVERVKEYLEVEQEAQRIVPERRPPPGWPLRGAVEFVNYSTRYRPDLDRVLKDVSFKVEPGEKVGIVGRTGAGKSSLALALFRGLEAEQGQIIIDGIDISTIGLQDLRENITIVPQDPTLFTGTIRSNLDPFGLFSDEQIFEALRRVHLIGGETSASTSGSATPATPHRANSPNVGFAEDHHPRDDNEGNEPTALVENKNLFKNLDSPVAESGSNLSQGQRQLLCLARALLKRPRVLMMDEATASIDYATDNKIQETLRELRDSTIITIAHRLQTIIDYDKVLVLDRGRVVEFDHPWTLITREGSVFRGMCESSGHMEGLLEGAEKAWRSRNASAQG